LYLGNFFKWDPNKHVKLVTEKYNWKTKETPYQRTYRNFSNLDDKYESGAHDLLKFIKFGYGRCSDHASKDIRDGYMIRSEGIEKVKQYDHIVSDDLYEWLEYVERDEKYFWQIADTFRDPRVWKIKNSEWWKNNIWGGPSAFGEVFLNKEQIEDFNQRQKKLKVNFDF